MKNFIFLLSLVAALSAQKADLVIFSYNRPMQLYATLESTEKHVSGLAQIIVLYRASAKKFEESYKTVKKRFPNVKFCKELPESETQKFRPLLMEILETRCFSPYLLFSTDDIIVTDQIDLEECATLMEEHEADAFHLRLGKNINTYYWKNQPLHFPPFQSVGNKALLWKYKEGRRYWSYSNTVDYTLYRRDKVLGDFQKLLFKNPNTLEFRWSRRRDLSLFGLCYENSKLLNIPLNLVNETTKNLHSNLYTANELLEMFTKGIKIDIMDLYQIRNPSPHLDYHIKFIPR